LWAELGGPVLPWRRLRVLIEHLPRDSAYAMAVHGARSLPTDETVWLPRIAYLLQLALWAQADPHKRGAAPPAPVTPFDEATDRRSITRSRLEDLYRRDRARRGVSADGDRAGDRLHQPRALGSGHEAGDREAAR
jgi:hypothetical protein